MQFYWNNEKNNQLKQDRNISFEDIVQSIHNDGLIEIIQNPSANFVGQKVLVIQIHDYIYLVPFVMQ